MRTRRLWCVLPVLVWAALASGAVRMQTPGDRVSFHDQFNMPFTSLWVELSNAPPGAMLPESSPFSIVLWMRLPDAPIVSPFRVLTGLRTTVASEAPTLAISYRPSPARLRCEVKDADGSEACPPMEIDLTGVQAGGWGTVGLSYDPAASAWGGVTFAARFEGMPAVGMVCRALNSGQVIGGLRGMSYGAAPDGSEPAQVDSIMGLIAARTHVIDTADIDAIFASRDYSAPWRFENSGSGGHMSGKPGAAWMTGHGMMSQPSGSSISSGLPGQFVAPTNLLIYDRNMLDDIEREWHTRVTIAGEPMFVDHFWKASPYFENQPTDDVAIAETGVPVSGVNTILYQMAHSAPSGQYRVVVWGNSRGSRAICDDAGTADAWAQHYADGLAQALVERGTWRGGGFHLSRKSGSCGGLLEFVDEQPRKIGVVHEVESLTAGPLQSWRYVGTGNLLTNFNAPIGGVGRMLALEPGDKVTFMSPDGKGGIGVADDLVFDVILARFPGAGDVRFSKAIGASAGALPMNSEPTDHTGRSTATTGDLAVTGYHVTVPSLTVSGVGHDIAIGDVVVVQNGGAAGGVSMVTGISEAGGETTVTLEEVLVAAPTTGDIVRFGPLEFERLTLMHFGGDEPAETFRGFSIENIDAGASFVIALTTIAYSPGAGFVTIPFGASGRGYDVQDAESFTTVSARSGFSPPQAYLRAMDVDLVMLAGAQQSTDPAALINKTAEVRAALGPDSVVWSYESVHGLGANGADGMRDDAIINNVDWHNFVAQEAGGQGVIGLSAFLDDARFGSATDQFSRGLRADTQMNYTARGNLLVAESWLEQALIAATPRCPGDLNGDLQVDINDLNAVLGNFGSAGPNGDADGDGAVDISDLNFVLGNFGVVCH